MGSVLRRDDNSRAKVQNVYGDSSGADTLNRWGQNGVIFQHDGGILHHLFGNLRGMGFLVLRYGYGIRVTACALMAVGAGLVVATGKR